MSLEEDEEKEKAAGDGLTDLLEPLEDLDDAEFGLPPVENLPTLEEILAEDDDLLRTVDDFDDDSTSCAGFAFNEGGIHMPSLSAALHQLGIEGIPLFSCSVFTLLCLTFTLRDHL